jgi:hypothetical protein
MKPFEITIKIDSSDDAAVLYYNTILMIARGFNIELSGSSLQPASSEVVLHNLHKYTFT